MLLDEVLGDVRAGARRRMVRVSSYLCCLQWRSLDEQQILAPTQRRICVLEGAHLCQLHSQFVLAIKKTIFHAILEI